MFSEWNFNEFIFDEESRRDRNCLNTAQHVKHLVNESNLYFLYLSSKRTDNFPTAKELNVKRDLDGAVNMCLTANIRR